MRKIRGVIVAACIAGVGVYALKGCLSPKAPDAKLAGQFEELCQIAKHNIETPLRGVKAMGVFAKRNTSDMLAELGDLVVLVESTSDADHDRRAIEAHETLAAPLRACERELMEFADAVEHDPEAKQLHDHALDRALEGLLLILAGPKSGGALLPMQELAPLLKH